MSDRLDRLVNLLPEKELDAFLVSAPENRRYLSGFTGSAGYLLITNERAVLVTDSRYTEQATKQAPDFQVIQVRGGWDWLMEQLKESGVKRVGFESRHMTVAIYNGLLDALKDDGGLGTVSLVATSDIAEEHRVFKDKDEIAMLQKAIDASDAAMEAVCPTIQAGMTEREVAWRMEVAMREFGADGISFDTIVAAGPNGAMAHHRPSDQPIRAGEPIVIDMGAQAGGYCSDITRTVVVGEPDDTFRIRHRLGRPAHRDKHRQSGYDRRGVRRSVSGGHRRGWLRRQLRSQPGPRRWLGGPRESSGRPQVDRLAGTPHGVYR